MHTQLSMELTCHPPPPPPPPTNSAQGRAAATARSDPFIYSETKQATQDTQHVSLDIKPHGSGAERAVYLKAVAVMGRTNVMGLLLK